jgi:hypothetical protein
MHRTVRIPVTPEAAVLALAALTMMAVFGNPAAVAAGPPQADTAAATAVIGPAGRSQLRRVFWRSRPAPDDSGRELNTAQEQWKNPAIGRRIEPCSSY